jgi:hypothetical protein
MSAFNEDSQVYQTTGATTGVCIASGKAWLDSYQFRPTGAGSGGLWNGTAAADQTQANAKAYYTDLAATGHTPSKTFRTPVYCPNGIWGVVSAGLLQVEFHR